MVDLVTTGYLTLDDLVLRDDRVLRNTLGGGALFSAVGARLWGLEVGIHACSGADYPQRFRQQIAEGGIDLQGVKVGPARSLRLWLLEEEEQRKQQLPKLNAANVAELDAGRGPLPSAYTNARGFHVAPSLPTTQGEIVNVIRTRAPRAVVTLDIWTESFFDAAPYRNPTFLAGVDAFLPSDKEVEALWGLDDLATTVRMLSACGPRTVAIKRGALGSLVYDRDIDMLWEIPALAVDPVDTIGAGDAYCGGFLAGLVETGSPLEAGLRGTVSASYAIQDYGAQPGKLPDPPDLRQRLGRARSQVSTAG